jgi:quercetin dioxygenase-like cupin family protein
VSASVVPPGEGELIRERPIGMSILGVDERLVVSEMRLGAGADGPRAHVHHTHSDGFWVLDGELTVLLGEDEHALPAGGFVSIPPNVVHTVRNASDADVRALNLHAPSAGFEDYLRAGRDGDVERRREFDQHEPPEDGGRPASDARLLGPGEGEALSIGPSALLFKATGDDPDGHLSLSESTIAPGFPGPVPHVHRTFTDSFYVLEGTLTLRVEEGTVEAGTGTYALVSPGTVHTFSNPGDAPVRFLNVMAPGGFERYLREVAALAADGPPDPAVMATIASRYDFEPAG